MNNDAFKKLYQMHRKFEKAVQKKVDKTIVGLKEAHHARMLAEMDKAKCMKDSVELAKKIAGECCGTHKKNEGGMNVQFVNMTPHVVNILSEGEEKVISPSGLIRLQEEITPLGVVGGVPIVKKVMGGSENLPPVISGVYYIVSLPVAQACRRPDFVVPDDLVRDGEGKILGCRRFATMV